MIQEASLNYHLYNKKKKDTENHFICQQADKQE